MTTKLIRLEKTLGQTTSALAVILVIALVLLPGAGHPASRLSEPVAHDAASGIQSAATGKTADCAMTTAPHATSPQDPSGNETESHTAEFFHFQEKQADAAKARTGREDLVVKVVDESGQAMDGVDFYVSAVTEVLGSRKVQEANVLSDEDGVARLALPNPLTLIRIWASKDGFVTLFFNWEEGETDSMPAEYSVVLQRGSELGGIVVDAQGKPVAGARVDVTLKEGGVKVDSQDRVALDPWLAEGEDRAVTDENGRWSINNAPAGDDLQLLFLIEHPDFIFETALGRGHPMGHYRVTLEQLRDQSARFELKNGIALRGRITDGEGNPVTKGLVIWGDRPYVESGSQEVAIGDDGSYRVPPQPTGRVRLTVVAPGWMPTDRVVELASDEDAGQDFQLQPGKKLHLKFIDAEGNPISGVFVGIERWHGVQALYNHRHPDVRNTEIPSVSDAEGDFVWDWAPDDLMRLQFSVRELNHTKTVEVLATGEPQTMTVRKPFALTGTVVEQTTGKPVERYSIVPIRYSSAGGASSGIAQRHWARTFDSANFTFDDAFRFDEGSLVAFRFQAVGYRDLTTLRFSADSPNLNTVIRLEPAPPRTLRVRRPDGQWAAAANVWVAQAGQGPIIYGFEGYFGAVQKPDFAIDERGEGRYGAPASRHAIIVAAAEGYAEKYLDVDDLPGEMTLRPWARLEGTLYQAGKPVPGAEVIVRPIRQLGGDHPQVSEFLTETTDAGGRFVFENIPPVPVTVQSRLSPWQDSPITSSLRLPVDLQPGKRHEVSLGGDGIQVVGRVRLLGDNADQIQFRYGLNDMLRLDGGIPTPEHAVERMSYDAGEAKAWNDKLVEGLDAGLSRESFFVKLRDDGSFLVSGVQSGRYRLLFRIYEPPAGCLVEPVGYGFLEFDTNDRVIQGNQLDLGTINIQLKPIPQVGEVLPDFRFIDLDERPHQISELRGQRVMIDFWASWCAPCLKAFPDLAKIRETIRPGDAATMISISVDEDIDLAKAVAMTHRLDGAVGFAGKGAHEGTTAGTLGISTVPTYIVLDPEGKILYRGFSHEDAAKAFR